jgi:outer membrane biosynthesis protein TonB
VETPPPLPEETPTLPVIEDPEKQILKKNTTTKKWLPASGTIDPKVARSFIKSNSNKVRACYERELKVNNLLQGKVTTSILINQDGSVANVKFISDSVGSQPMRQCIKQEIVSWRFPKPEGGRAEVQFPFKFEPKQ